MGFNSWFKGLRHIDGVEIQANLQSIWTSAPDGGEFNFMPRPLYPGEEPRTNWIESNVGHRTALGVLEEINNPCPCRDSSPVCPAHILVSTFTTLSCQTIYTKCNVSKANFSFLSSHAAAVVLNQCKINPVQPSHWVSVISISTVHLQLCSESGKILHTETVIDKWINSIKWNFWSERSEN
jgi:hypothetical protein